MNRFKERLSTCSSFAAHWIIGVPTPTFASTAGVLISFGCGLAFAGGPPALDFYLQPKIYLAIHERGLAYRSHIRRARIRYDAIAHIRTGPARHILEQAAFAITKRTHPRLHAASQRALAGTLRIDFVGGRRREIRQLLNHFDPQEVRSAFFWILKNQPMLLA